MRADRAHRLTAGVTFDHLAAAEYPFVAAILAAQAEFDFVAALLCQFVTDQSNGLLALFAGELCHKDVMHIVAEFARRIAQHGAVGGVYVSLAGAQVPVPDAIAGGFQREFVAFFAGADLRHHVRQRGSAFGHHGFQLGLAVALFGFYPLAFGDVVGDAEDADDPALSVVHRCLGCFEHALVAIRSEGEYFFIARRGAPGDGGLIVVAEELGLLAGHEIEIGFADDGCRRDTDTTLETLVAGEVDAVAVFQPDQVGNGLQQGLQVGPLARQFAVGPADTGNEQRPVDHHVGDRLVNVAKQVEDVGDVGIEREEQFGQSKYPGGSGQPQSVRLALLQRRAVEQECGQSIQ